MQEWLQNILRPFVSLERTEQDKDSVFGRVAKLPEPGSFMAQFIPGNIYRDSALAQRQKPNSQSASKEL